MERYTENHYDGNGYYLICSGNCETLNCGDCDILGEIVDRLAAYEDTGLEPEEIEQLKGEVFGLKVDKQELEQYRAIGPIDRLAAYEDTGLEPEDFKRSFDEGALLFKDMSGKSELREIKSELKRIAEVLEGMKNG